MKKQLLLALASVFMVCQSQAQTDKLWTPHKGGDVTTAKSIARETFPKSFQLFELNIEPLRQTLFTAQSRSQAAKGVVVSLPNANGQLEKFEVFESSNFDPQLQAQFPEIRAYVGQGLTDKYAQVRLSISPLGIQTMTFRADKDTEFMEPYSQDGKVYAVFNSSKREKGKLPYTCSTADVNMSDKILKNIDTQRSSSLQLLTFRLALSCTGEYANYFGATSAAQVALVNAAYNATMTRVNGVYEKDFAIHLNIIPTNNSVIYYNAATDPYSPAANLGNWNAELQNTLTTVITDANYDVGHLFGASGGGGNAGCIGCVCDAGKGSGYTSPADNVPAGDTFDIDFVAHELGHQFGANHTMTHSSENNAVNYEPGSGSTIMGYAGITFRNVQMNSDPYFHAGSIAQVQTNMATKSCQTTTAITHSAPVVNAGADYTIPRSTPFTLTGSATDAGGGALTYCWEQYDDAPNAANLCGDSFTAMGDNDCLPVATKVLGPVFRSYSPSASPSRTFPRIQSVLNGQVFTQGSAIVVEQLSSVARTLNFRLTARDNVAAQGQTNFDNSVVTIDATRGPLTVTSQNVNNQNWLQNSTQTITWAVNNTSTSTGGANVDILLSTDGGLTYPTVLLANTPNDGSQNITVPNITAQKCRVMVKASGSIFFNVNLRDIAIGYTVADACNTYSNNTVLPVPDNSPANNSPGTVVAKTISVPITSNIADVNVTLAAAHVFAWDMAVAMNHPDGTQVALWNRNCNNASTGFNIVFDDGQPAIVCVTGGSPTGTYAPAGSLASLNGKPANGTWTLLAADYWAGDAGSLGNWSIQICSKVYTLSNAEFEFEDFALYPNPNNGDFTVKFNSTSANDIKINIHDIRGRQVYEKSFSNTGAFNQNINLDKVQSGVYLVSIIDGAKKTVKRIVVE